MDWIIFAAQVFLGIAAFGSGVMKIIPGETVPKKNFAKMQLPAWWLAPIGMLEALCGIGLLIGFWWPTVAAISAALMACTMLGAVSAHVRSLIFLGKKYDGYPALVLLVISAGVLIGRWVDLAVLVS
jgi:uncharacterized membrane protein YphA (DoxX/SURF4 family)